MCSRRALHLCVLCALSTRHLAAQGQVLAEAARLDSEQKCNEAEQLYRTVAKGPQTLALLNNLGNHYLTCGAPEKARRYFESALKVNPAHPNANLQLARLAIERRDGPGALAHLDRIRDADPVVKLARVEALVQAGRRGEAVQLIDSLTKESQGDPRLLFAAGITCGRIGLYDQAEAAFHAVLTQVPDDFEALYNLGLAAARAEHYDRARQAFEVALKIQPGQVDALFELGRVEANLGNYNQALYLLANARTLAPQRPDILLALARAAQGAGFFGDADTIYSDYLKLRPEDDLVRRDRAAVRGFSDSGRAEGLKELTWYVRKYPRDAVGYYDLAQITYYTDRAAALSQVSRAVELDASFEPARYIRAWLLHRLGRNEEAIADLQAAVRLKPRDTLAFDQLGLTYMELDKLPEAEKAFRHAIANSPEEPKALLHLARLLEDSGRADEAQQFIKRFRKAQPDEPRRPHQEQGILTSLGLPPAERTRRTIEQLQQRAAANPADPVIELNLASLLLLEGKADDAAIAFRKLLAMQPPAAVCYSAGARLLAQEQYALARDFLQRAASEVPAAHLDLAIAIFFLDGADAALQALQQVPEGSDDGDRLLLKAKILDAAGHTADADQALREAMRFAISRPRLAEDVALLAVRHERGTTALSVVEQALKSAPDDSGLMLTRAAVLASLHRDNDAGKAVRLIEGRWPEWDEPYVIEGLLLERAKRLDEARGKIRIAIALGTRDPAAFCAQSRLAAAESAHVDCSCEEGVYQVFSPGCGKH